MKRRGRLGAWRFAECFVASLTTPPTDITTADADVLAAIRESRLFAWSETMVAAVDRAWRTSMVRRLVERASATGQGWLRVDRVRAVGMVIAVAMATALLVETLETSLDGPLRWILPGAVGLLGIVMALAAAPIARIGGGRRA